MKALKNIALLFLIWSCALFIQIKPEDLVIDPVAIYIAMPLFAGIYFLADVFDE